MIPLAATGASRVVRIEAPESISLRQELEVVLIASTDFGHGERIGFLQAESSTDGTKTWQPLCYLANIDATASLRFTVKAGEADSGIRIRLRVAFRDGLAGDVDYRGAAIRWKDEWEKWKEPPAIFTKIAVRPR